MIRTLRSASLLALGLGFPATLATAQTVDPFAPGERWGHASSSANPWLPDSVAFAGGGELVACAARGSSGGLSVFGAHDAPSVGARHVDARYAAAQGATLVAAGERADAVFALAQYPAPDVYSRRVELTRHDPVAAARGGSFAPVWTRELDIRINGPSRLAADSAGDVVVAAAWNDRTANVRIDRVDGSTGALLARRDLPAPGLSRLAVSGDGRRVAVSAGLVLWILDEQGHTVAQRPLTSAAQALSFSEDGATLAVGSTSRLEVLQENALGGWTLRLRIDATNAELAATTAVSADGGEVAVAWWNFSTGTTARLDLWSVASGTLEATWTQLGNPTSRQNLPSDLAITADGRRAAFGLWGNGGAPEVVLLEAGRALPVITFDLPGSVRALDLDATGTRIAVAHKNVHNSQWGASGAVRLLDTGERPLALMATPTAGGELRMATRHAGAGIAFFALGEPAAPQAFPGVNGDLLLRRGTLSVWPAAVDAQGRADLALPLSPDPNLVGTRFHVQSAFRTPAGLALSSNRLDALVLD